MQFHSSHFRRLFLLLYDDKKSVSGSAWSHTLSVCNHSGDHIILQFIGGTSIEMTEIRTDFSPHLNSK